MPNIEVTDREMELVKVSVTSTRERAQEHATNSPTAEDRISEERFAGELQLLEAKLDDLAPGI